jgi:hypothetical protein
MTITGSYDAATREQLYLVRVSDLESADIGQKVIASVIGEVSKRIADDYLANHATEVLAKITPEAVASMAIAEAGAAVNETLHKKLPDKILEVERRVVYQRGVFGGLRRL